MSVRKLKPITPGQRFRIVNEYSEVTTSKPEKSLLKPMKKSGGRNNQGRMTMRYKGGGHKRRYRVIDFKRDKYDVVGEVTSIEYDPNRSVFLFSNIKYIYFFSGTTSKGKSKITSRCNLIFAVYFPVCFMLFPDIIIDFLSISTPLSASSF